MSYEWCKNRSIILLNVRDQRGEGAGRVTRVSLCSKQVTVAIMRVMKKRWRGTKWKLLKTGRALFTATWNKGLSNICDIRSTTNALFIDSVDRSAMLQNNLLIEPSKESVVLRWWSVDDRNRYGSQKSLYVKEYDPLPDITAHTSLLKSLLNGLPLDVSAVALNSTYWMRTKGSRISILRKKALRQRRFNHNISTAEQHRISHVFRLLRYCVRLVFLYHSYLLWNWFELLSVLLRKDGVLRGDSCNLVVHAL